MKASKHHPQPEMTIEAFFLGYPLSYTLFTVLQAEIETVGACEMRISKSQIAFRHKKAFAWVWIPAKYQHGKTAPLVLSLVLPTRNPSPRWKEIVEPYPGRYMHHLELFSAEDIDEQVRAWLGEAWSNAGHQT